MSSPFSSPRTERHAPNILMISMTALIGLPILIFILLVVKGFIGQTANHKPEDIVAIRITKSEATVSWTTANNTLGIVEYGTSPGDLSSFAPEVTPKKEHEVDLTLLSPATTYYFQLRIENEEYDNNGVPWTFTTKTKDGKDVAALVKGIATKRLGEDQKASNEANLSLGACEFETCEEIQQHLGKGCGVSDYYRCLSKPKTTLTPGYIDLSITPYPTPTTILIVSNLCQISYLQVGNDCTKWSWDSFDTKPQTCRNAFDRYVFQCRSKSFISTNDQDIPTWFYNNALTQTSSSSATLQVTPDKGAMVYCQVRAEDSVGGSSHSTQWVSASAQCK